MKKRALIVFVFFLSVQPIFSQDLPMLIPPSPNTAALEKYGEIPIGLFTGSPQISIPIYNFKTTNLSTPITLRYSSNGVRVGEYSSNVGMGWDLNVGGMITRRINDDPDEHPQVHMPDIYTQLFSEEMFLFLVHKTGKNTQGSFLSPDFQPDEYTFNFNGYSGKFYLDSNSDIFT